MKYKSGILFLIFFTIAASDVSAQTVTKLPKPFKPPVVKSAIGIRNGRDTITLDEARQLVRLPIIIKDAHGNSYKIKNYRLLYRQKGYIENPETGKPEVNYTTIASRFDTSPLPKVWSDNLQTKLRPGDELSFFEILVSDSKGREFFAPDLILITQ